MMITMGIDYVQMRQRICGSWVVRFCHPRSCFGSGVLGTDGMIPMHSRAAVVVLGGWFGLVGVLAIRFFVSCG